MFFSSKKEVEKIKKIKEPMHISRSFKRKESAGCSIISDLPTEVRGSMLECPHLHLWLALAQWGRMSCCISSDVQKWECTTAFTELHALHWSQRETISPQRGLPSLTKTIQMQNHMKMGPSFHGSTWITASRHNKQNSHAKFLLPNSIYIYFH